MVLVSEQFHPVKGEYPSNGDCWPPEADAFSHPLYASASAKRQSRPRVRTTVITLSSSSESKSGPYQVKQQKPTDSSIEQEEHWCAIVLTGDGQRRFKSSPSMRHYKKIVLNAINQQAPETVQPLQYAHSGKQVAATLKCSPSAESLPAQHVSDRVDPDNCLEQGTTLGSLNAGTSTISQPFANRRQKRARASTEAGSKSQSSERGSKAARVQSTQTSEKKLIQLEIGKAEDVEHWIIEAFDAVQQVTCRLIAKLWIKKIEPKKQSAHPYNGGLPKDEVKDPNRTRPSYWPLEVPHKEPDHIQKIRELLGSSQVGRANDIQNELPF